MVAMHPAPLNTGENPCLWAGRARPARRALPGRGRGVIEPGPRTALNVCNRSSLRRPFAGPLAPPPAPAPAPPAGGPGPPPPPRLGTMIVLSVTGIGAFNTLQYWALEHTQALNTLLLQSPGPLFVAIWSRMLSGVPLGL